MVGTSNLGSCNGHWSKGRFQVQFAFSSTVRITPQGTDALRGQVLAGGHLQPSDWGWWPPIKMVTTGDGWWNWAYHMSKIWVCYFFGLFEQFIELETHVYRLPCLLGYLFAGLSPFFWWSKRVKGKTLQQTLYFASQVFICWAWTLLAWMDCASAFYKFNSKPIQEKVGTRDKRSSSWTAILRLAWQELWGSYICMCIYLYIYIYVCVCVCLCVLIST